MVALDMGWTESSGVIAQGHRVASGACGDPRFPEGTIAPQLPLLRAAVPDLETYLGGPAHAGTINLRFPGRVVSLGAPETFVPDVAWTECFPPENFFLSRAELAVGGAWRAVFLYIPDPATKPDHPAAPDGVELLARFVPGLAYGDAATLRYRGEAIRIAAG